MIIIARLGYYDCEPLQLSPLLYWHINMAIPSPIFILVFFALKTYNILCAKVTCRYYILCAVKSKRQIFNFGEGIDLTAPLNLVENCP